MKKFRFKFESVEKVRKSKEDDALRVLADAQRAFAAEKARRDQLDKDLLKALIGREQLGIEPTLPVDFHLQANYITGLKQRIVQAEQAIKRASRGVEKALRAYLFARRQLRTMELMREKAMGEWRKERSKYEQKQTEELYVMRAGMGREVAS